MRSRVENARVFDAQFETGPLLQPMTLTVGAAGLTLPASRPPPAIIALNATAAAPLVLPPITVAAGNTGMFMEGRQIKVYNTSAGAFTITVTPATSDPAIVGTATVAQNAVGTFTVVNGVWRAG